MAECTISSRRCNRAQGAIVQFRNFLLSALDPADLAALGPHLVEAPLNRAQVLYEPGDTVDALYFPGSACVSVLTVLDNGEAVETSTIGRESAAGLLNGLTGQPASQRMFAQIGGSVLKISASVYTDRFEQSPALRRLSLLHTRAIAIQAEQSVACNLAHSVTSRLARWLLMTQDRVGANAFFITQDYMAMMTGMQRTTVSQAAAVLKSRKIINYSRGALTVVDRAALEHTACECYATVAAQFEDMRALKE